jgi:hypothetical protein
MTRYGPDGVGSLHSHRLTCATDLSCAPSMCGTAGGVTFSPAINGVIPRIDLSHSRCFRVNSRGFHPVRPDEGRERSRNGRPRPPHPSPISNRDVDLLERDLNHCKQRSATVSNRELSTVRNSTIGIVQPVLPTQGSQPPLRQWRSQPSISDMNSRRLAPFLPGSAQNVECDVTHSKQKTATFLPGSRIAHLRFAVQQVQP